MLINQPSRLKYIGAWIFAGILSGILQTVLDTLLAESLVQDLSDLNAYFIAVSVLSVPVAAGSIILVYNYFSSLNMRKVMPYFYSFGALGTLINMAQTSTAYLGLDANLNVFYITTPISFIAIVFLIRNYYFNKQDRWF
jgi:hypothetical protein